MRKNSSLRESLKPLLAFYNDGILNLSQENISIQIRLLEYQNSIATTSSELSSLWDFRSQRVFPGNLMGCVTSNENSGVGSHMICIKDTQTSNSLPTLPINEMEVDLSHFSTPKEILGIGGFGIVRRVVKSTCSDIGMSYALKSISKQTVLSRPSGTRAVMTELKALIMISDCEHICSLKYAFQDDSFLYMVIEYCSGGDMRYNLRKAPQYRFSETTSKIIIRQVISAVQHCHNSYILHRDVKPENILLFEDGRIKLSDFGVAKVLPDIEQCRSTSGTHGYMAPEIYADDHTHGAAFDWFCVGITLHEFLSGRRPYEATRLQRYYANDCIDRLELDYLPRMPVSVDCVSFMREILRPDPLFRLGGNGGEIEIHSHSWLNREKPLVFEDVVLVLREELPVFNELFEFKRTKRTVHRMNISREEAVSLVRQHQDPCLISAEVQGAFRDFEFNTKVSSPIYGGSNSTSNHISRSQSLATTSVAGDMSRSRSGSAGNSTGLRPQLPCSRSSSGMQESYDDHADAYQVEDDGEDSLNDDQNNTHNVLQQKDHAPPMNASRDFDDDEEHMKVSPSEREGNTYQHLPSERQYLNDPHDPQLTIPYTASTLAAPRTRARPQSDRIVSYKNSGMKHHSLSAKLQPDDLDTISSSSMQQERYKPHRRLSFPSPNGQQDDYPYSLHQTSNHNPKAISWRKIPSIQNASADNRK